MQNKHGLIFVAQSKLIASYWKTSTFHGFGQMCLSEVLCLNDAQTRRPMAQVSAAHAASTCLGSSRSLHLSLRSTARSFQQVTWRPVKHWFIEFCLIYCTCEQKHRFCWLPSVSYHLEPNDLKNIWSEIEMMNCHLYLVLRSESETASVWEQLHKILAALWSEECLWLMSQILNCWHWTWKVSMLNCQTKKLTDVPFQGFVHVKLEHQPPAKYRKEKKSLICFVLARYAACGWGP